MYHLKALYLHPISSYNANGTSLSKLIKNSNIVRRDLCKKILSFTMVITSLTVSIFPHLPDASEDDSFHLAVALLLQGSSFEVT